MSAASFTSSPNLAPRSLRTRLVGLASTLACAALCVGLTALPAAAAAAAPATPPSTTVTVEIDHSVLPADTPGHAIIQVNLDTAPAPQGKERAPVNVAVVLDRSGSMSGEKIARAREAAIAAVRRLGPKDWFSLVVYDDRIETLVPSQQVRDVAAVERLINGIKPGGNTALFAGVSQGAAELRKQIEQDMIHRLILLSDGQANAGPSTPDDLGRLGAALAKEGISVTTVGLGDGFNEDLMAKLAQTSDGNNYFVRDSSDLVRVFGAELGEVTSAVAKSVEVRIVLPAGVKAIRLIGREGRIEDGQVSLQLNQLYGSQRKFALLEVEVAPRAAGTEQKVADVTVTYDDLVGGVARQQSASATVRFSPKEAEHVESANQEVLANYGVNESAIAKDKVIELFDQGKKEEALAELTRNAEKLRGLADYNQNVALTKQADELEEQRDELNKRGLDNDSRKAMRNSAYQDYNQQYAK